MATKEQNHAADSGAFRQSGGPFDYSPGQDEEKRRAEALKSHDRGEQNGVYFHTTALDRVGFIPDCNHD